MFIFCSKTFLLLKYIFNTCVVAEDWYEEEYILAPAVRSKKCFALRRLWSFEEGPRSCGADSKSAFSEQEMLRARIRNPRNPPKDLVLRRKASLKEIFDVAQIDLR